MSTVYFAGDLHFGHKNIGNFRPVLSESDHREMIIDRFNQVLKKRDTLYLMGDIAFTPEMVEQLDRIKCGYKFLILGNHDIKDTALWLQHVDDIFGIEKYKRAWLTHCPIHPAELRGRINIHGHVHNATIEDNRYFNTSLENTNYNPISYADIVARTCLAE